MSTKLLIFMQSLGGGGAERTIINIINNLNKETYSITLVVGDYKSNAYTQYMKDNIKVVDLKSPRLRYSVFKLRKVITEEKPDIIFTTVNHNNILTSIIKALIIKNRPKLVVREASLRTETNKVNKLNKIVTKICYNYIANGVIALSKGVKEDLISNFGVKGDKIKVIYNPVDIKTIERLRNIPVDEEILEKNEKVIISVGRLDVAKDYPTLLKAFQIVAEKIDVKLIIAGVGPLEDYLKQMTKELGIHDKVLFKGFLTNPYNYMSNSNVFVLTSRWEGFGHVIVEAMASEVPVISTNCNTGPKEIITHNLNGKLVDVGDYKQLAETIIETLNSDNKEQIKNAKIRSRDFDAPKIVGIYDAYFKEILSE